MMMESQAQLNLWRTNISLSFFLGMSYLRTCLIPHISMNLHLQTPLHSILPNNTQRTAPRPSLRTDFKSPTMKSSIIASALLYLTSSLAYAAPGSAAIKARQEFEVSITFTGEGPTPSTYFQQFPTDNQPYAISKQPFTFLKYPRSLTIYAYYR